MPYPPESEMGPLALMVHELVEPLLQDTLTREQTRQAKHLLEGFAAMLGCTTLVQHTT